MCLETRLDKTRIQQQPPFAPLGLRVDVWNKQHYINLTLTINLMLNINHKNDKKSGMPLQYSCITNNSFCNVFYMYFMCLLFSYLLKYINYHSSAELKQRKITP